MEKPFVTLIADRKADYDGAAADERYPLLHVTFKEESYDATCIAVQHLVDALPGMFAGDTLRVQFVHTSPEYSAAWEGVMPSHSEATGVQHSSKSERILPWREFVRDVHRGTR